MICNEQVNLVCICRLGLFPCIFRNMYWFSFLPCKLVTCVWLTNTNHADCIEYHGSRREDEVIMLLGTRLMLQMFRSRQYDTASENLSCHMVPGIYGTSCSATAYHMAVYHRFTVQDTGSQWAWLFHFSRNQGQASCRCSKETIYHMATVAYARYYVVSDMAQCE
jgi:hypothetical protein